MKTLCKLNANFNFPCSFNLGLVFAASLGVAVDAPLKLTVTRRGGCGYVLIIRIFKLFHHFNGAGIWTGGVTFTSCVLGAGGGAGK